MPSESEHQQPATQPVGPVHTPQPRRLKPFSFVIALLTVLIVITLIVTVTQHYRQPQTTKTPISATVHITTAGFQPATLMVKTGTQVVWIGDDTQQPHQVASNPYPSDTGLAGLKSSQLGNGAQFRYTFSRTGTYKYHDDLNPTLNGTIVVKN